VKISNALLDAIPWTRNTGRDFVLGEAALQLQAGGDTAEHTVSEPNRKFLFPAK
jgi:hypothetical protein